MLIYAYIHVGANVYMFPICTAATPPSDVPVIITTPAAVPLHGQQTRMNPTSTTCSATTCVSIDDVRCMCVTEVITSSS